ncbi:MAG TPA: winged helix-turn-helix domain-containing protein [Solirubrobacterales bacterium]|nr:winged helix-turn-helix domain-containing protein [Solirubrobacterales bacterium]
MATPSEKTGEQAKGGVREIVDQQLIKALAHPVRAQALSILNERVASPNEIAKELDQGVGHVSYHINVLKQCECIELVGTEPRRGAVEHYYRATTRIFLDDEDWRRLPASVRPGMSASLIQNIVDDAGSALSAGTFDARDDRHLAWNKMIVDEKGWNDLNQVLGETLERVLEIQAAAAARLSEAGETGFQVSAVTMAYETATDGQRRPVPQMEGPNS